MADITMCLNLDCPLEHSCFRAKAIPSDRQSYAVFQYSLSVAGVRCEHYLSMFKTEIRASTITVGPHG